MGDIGRGVGCIWGTEEGGFGGFWLDRRLFWDKPAPTGEWGVLLSVAAW